MTSTHIHTLSARYIVPPGDPRVVPRLDRLLRRVLDEALEPALERAGVPVDATVCVRSVTSRATLELGASDDALVLAWSLRLSQTIATAVDRGAADVAIFSSSHHVLTAFAADIAAANLTRAWAYRQLGFGDLAHTSPARHADLLICSLEREPAAIVPILVTLARDGRLPALVAGWTAAHWQALARAAARRHGLAADALLSARTGPPELGPAHHPDSPTTARPEDRHDGAALTRPTSGPPEPPEARHDGALALALLALGPSLPAEARHAAALLAALAAEPACLQRLTHHVHALLRRFTRAPGRPQTRADTRPPAAPAATASTKIAKIDAVRPAGDTEHGGLLFLIHIVDALGLPAELTTDPIFAARSTRWVLHRVGIALTAAAPHDPAILAFAGLPPDADPPAHDEPASTPAEAEHIADLAHRITAALHRRLAEPSTPAPTLLARVCRRRARIVADPGWFAVHLPIERVDTVIRRAGLDLDPNFVPWLGVVLKFIYA